MYRGHSWDAVWSVGALHLGQTPLTSCVPQSLQYWGGHLGHTPSTSSVPQTRQYERWGAASCAVCCCRASYRSFAISGARNTSAPPAPVWSASFRLMEITFFSSRMTTIISS